MREFTVAEIAELLDVNEETVRRWRIRGRNGVQLAVPSVGDRPGRKGYRITSGAVRHFLAMNPSLMTVAMQEALAQDGASPQTAAPAVRNARRNWVLLFLSLSSTKTLRMGSAGEGSLVAAFCKWAKAAFIRLPDVHRVGVRGARLWRGSKFRSFLFGCFLMQIFLSERKNGHNTA